MLYQVTHRTTYGYGTDVAVSHHLAHLHPRDLPWQKVADFTLTIGTADGNTLDGLTLTAREFSRTVALLTRQRSTGTLAAKAFSDLLFGMIAKDGLSEG